MASPIDDALRVADQPETRGSFVHFLLDLLRVDTTVGPDLDRVRANEEEALDLISQAVETFLGTWRGLERVPIDPRIEADPYYTPVHYTKTAERPEGLGAAEAYRGRSNLVLRVPVEGDVVYGRGACDDKGQCAVMLLALYLIEHARWREPGAGEGRGLIPPADLLLEFVIDEEPGGNGSLSLALDRRFAFDALVVLEATNLAVHPGNRGAVWYRLDLDGSAAPGLDLVGLAASLVLALEEEGAALKAESAHPLFPHRPVQTCHGVLGPWGKHPSAVNDHVELALFTDGEPDLAKLRAIADRAVADYVAAYGDKTREADPATGRPKVDHHYDLDRASGGARLVVHGKAGHMGAILQCDDAITKAAYIVRALEADKGLRVRRFSVESEAHCRFPIADCRLQIAEAELRAKSEIGNRKSEIGDRESPTLVLEGGQGFLPTHSLREVTERMRRAVADAAAAYCRQHGVACPPGLARMSFDKLHNDAFARDPGRPAVRAFVECVRAAGIEVPEPLRGWDVSCDARVFAREYPAADIITFGTGRLEHAHSAQEQVRVDDIAAAAKAVARFALTFEPQARDS